MVFFSWLCVPLRVRDGHFTFNWRPRYWLQPPVHGNLVVTGLAGGLGLALVRVVGAPGDRVEFRKGTLILNGKLQPEPYVRGACTWSMPAVRVEEGEFFVALDDRGGPPNSQVVGLIPAGAVIGGPLW